MHAGAAGADAMTAAEELSSRQPTSAMSTLPPATESAEPGVSAKAAESAQTDASAALDASAGRDESAELDESAEPAADESAVSKLAGLVSSAPVLLGHALSGLTDLDITPAPSPVIKHDDSPTGYDDSPSAAQSATPAAETNDSSAQPDDSPAAATPNGSSNTEAGKVDSPTIAASGDSKPAQDEDPSSGSESDHIKAAKPQGGGLFGFGKRIFQGSGYGSS